MRDPDLYVEWKRRSRIRYFWSLAFVGSVATVFYLLGFVNYNHYGPPIFQYVVSPAVAALFCGAAGWIWVSSKIPTVEEAAARCRGCGYDRRGHDGDSVCPECGHVPDAEDAKVDSVRGDVKSLLAYALPGTILIVLAMFQGGMALITFWGLRVGAFE